jgi:hypothetical protein
MYQQAHRRACPPTPLPSAPCAGCGGAAATLRRRRCRLLCKGVACPSEAAAAAALLQCRLLAASYIFSRRLYLGRWMGGQNVPWGRAASGSGSAAPWGNPGGGLRQRAADPTTCTSCCSAACSAWGTMVLALIGRLRSGLWPLWGPWGDGLPVHQSASATWRLGIGARPLTRWLTWRLQPRRSAGSRLKRYYAGGMHGVQVEPTVRPVVGGRVRQSPPTAARPLALHVYEASLVPAWGT